MVSIQPLTADDQSWALQLSLTTQVYCPDCGREHLGLSAKRNNEVLGYIAWQIVLDEASLLGIAVQPFARRQHIATTLHEHSEQQLLTQNVRTLFLEVRQSNTAAQAFYQQLGYEQVGLRKHYYQALATASPQRQDREHAVVMRKKLQAFDSS